MTAFFAADDLAKWFHVGTDAEVHALDGVSLVVPAGAFVVVTGASGSGKTTLLALLATLERPTRGTVRVDGDDVAHVSEAARGRLRRRIGVAFGGGPMIARLPLWENVTLGRAALGIAAGERRAEATALLELVDLGRKLRAVPEELSTGELQRASLARALAGRPEALLVDEPLANLDPPTRTRILDVLRSIHAGGATLVVASHQPEALALATMRIRLDGGRQVPA